MNEAALIEKFNSQPELAYEALLKRYSNTLLRMIRRFMRDPDEVMEVYTAICERLRAHDFQALRRFRTNNDLTPWLSVVVANACRDRFRKRRLQSIPQAMLDKLSEVERLVFQYYFQNNLPYGEIAEMIKGRHRIECTTLDVVAAIGRMNELLSVSKRWNLLLALNARHAPQSIEEMMDAGFELKSGDAADALVQGWQHEAQLKWLSEALGEQTAEDQLLVMLRFEHGLRANRIAEMMGYENPKYVYTRLRTIINRLRRELPTPALATG